MTTTIDTAAVGALTAKVARHVAALESLNGGSWRALSAAHDMLASLADEIARFGGSDDNQALIEATTRAARAQADMSACVHAERPHYEDGRELLAALQAIAGFVQAVLDKAMRPRPEIAAHPAMQRGEVVEESSLECCRGQLYDNPGVAYVHTRCRRLLQPWGDVHSHPLCTCYGKPSAAKDDGGTLTVIDIT